ncbi:hybrid sensor histidine kinase/response regulator [Sandaracinus amylolyticus]|uniref:hybrid sensor histidine kinase/response regulator n=1 Tax=Sandaracinus amylolyticus TaxID=927083 RepID=UPI001F193CDB|nr:PAS domain-containing sensor histidine kinase [Sandaracinus amylolyticus]
MAHEEPPTSAIDVTVPDVPSLGVVLVDLRSCCVVRANAAFLELIAFSRDDLSREPLELATLLAPERRAVLESVLEEVASSGRFTPFEITLWRRDGTGRHVWLTGAVHPAHRDLAHVYVVDITQNCALVEALRESEERARRFAEASFEGLFVHDQGRVLDVNEVLPAMFRTTREELLGRSALDFAAEASRAMLRDNVLRQYELPYEAMGKRADGTTFPMEVLGKPIPFEGRTVRVTAVRDLTERKRTEAALREAESALLHAQKLESLGVLAGGIAHDFNNLLAIVLAFTGVAQRHIEPGSPAYNALREVEHASRRAADLTRQMLVYSGRSARTIAPLSLDEVVRGIAQLASSSFSKKIDLELSLAGGLPPLAADRSQIEQLVLNLLTNAGEAIGDEPGTIAVRTHAVDLEAGEIEGATTHTTLPAGRYLELEVRDTGCGMDESTRARMFDPFFSTKAHGRGLGLSAMLGILRSHGAGLAITTAPGAGTTFRIYFPIAERIDDPARPPSVVPAPRRREGAVVLIADDEPALRRATRAVLVSAGYQVLEAADGAEAVDLFQRHADVVALVLLDLHMPKLDGREAFNAIRAIDPRVGVLLTSGFDVREVLEGLRGQKVSFLPKPSTSSQLLAAVDAALAAPTT